MFQNVPECHGVKGSRTVGDMGEVIRQDRDAPLEAQGLSGPGAFHGFRRPAGFPAEGGEVAIAAADIQQAPAGDVAFEQAEALAPEGAADGFFTLPSGIVAALVIEAEQFAGSGTRGTEVQAAGGAAADVGPRSQQGLGRAAAGTELDFLVVAEAGGAWVHQASIDPRGLAVNILTMLRLPTVTLAMAESADPEWAARVLEYCTRGIRFGAVRLWTFARPRAHFFGQCHPLPKMGYVDHYLWMARELGGRIQAGHVLTVHRDGFVLNPEHWSEAFLEYDYIGAPWPASWGYAHRVGNGGFSLRSARFLRAMAEHGPRIRHPEDAYFCLEVREEMEAQGLRFAPPEVAARFALEHPVEEMPDDDRLVFGFHGWTKESRRALSLAVRDGRHRRPLALVRDWQWNLRAGAGTGVPEGMAAAFS